MERYEKYKDSGIDWLCNIPDHWKTKKLKYLIKSLESGVSVNSIDVPVSNENYGILKTSCVYKYIFEPNENKEILTSEFHRAKINPRKGEIIISRMNTPDLVGASGYVDRDYNYLFLPDRLWQTVFFPYLKIETRWLSFVFKSFSFRELLSILATGTSSSMKNIGQEGFLNIEIPFPELEEQKTIARYLDRKTAEIDQLIAQKERLIELYEEEKTAIINHAVTKGINLDVKLKPSGIDWVGDIPEHWKPVKIRYYSEFVTSGSRGWSQYFSDSGSVFLRITNVSGEGIELNLQDIKRVLLPSDVEGERAKVSSGDVIISITADLGSVVIVPDAFQEAYVSQHLALVKPLHSKIYSQWIAYQVCSSTGKKQLLSSGYGGTKIQLSLTDIRDLWITLPPLEEQKAIAHYIETETARIDAKIAKTKKIIELQKEYRTALISEAVTGKIKVPELAT